MPALVAGIHVFSLVEDVDGRDEPGHDAKGLHNLVAQVLGDLEQVLVAAA
ncbi:hypothetical protein FHR70_003227 [Microvirga lupini]|uniref:Uncharacterized protein n=1 Tax=Microvirga lupini TaxID=420324 RepID=A0A7W4VNK9_9HYPH|nr:hypothetical protein [Microvirga lupini]